MRTTVTLDPDTEEIIRRRMAAEGVSFKHALNATVRDGARSRTPATPFVTRTAALGRPLVDLTKATRLATRLDDEAIVAKLHRDA